MPGWVWRPAAPGQTYIDEGPIQLETVVAAFPDQRIFNADKTTFLEFDRATVLGSGRLQ